MLSFYLIWSLIYYLLLSELAKFWPENSAKSIPQSVFPKVSILISCRNESENMLSLSDALRKINYPNLEIIFLDDGSEDGTYELIKAARIKDPRIVPLKNPGIGKKTALEYGVSQAQGEIILSTDADCSFPADWVEGMISPFENAEIQLVSGPVMTTENQKFLGAFQKEDWGSILLVTNYFFSKKKPLMCSAANLAYRKNAFLEVRGYDGNKDFASGDDEFLLKKIGQVFGNNSSVYLPFVSNLVMTKPESTWKSLLNQRVRWAGKWKAHRSFSHATSAISTFLVQPIWIGSFALLTLGLPGCVIFGLVWVIKIGAEIRSIGRVLKILKVNIRKVDFFATSYIHPFYVLVVGVWSIFGNFDWKGRRNNRTV